MGAIVSCNQAHDGLLNQVKKLRSDSLTLVSLLANESIRLSRHDQASQLESTLSFVRQQVNEAVRLENAARSGYNEAHLVVSGVGLLAGVAIWLASENKQARAFSRHLLTNLGGKKPPFGTILVCVGSEGLPDDVQVVRISDLARRFDRQESEVVGELLRHGCRLFRQEEFSRLVDGLVREIREGRITLPIPAEKLVEPINSTWVKIEPARLRYVALPPKQ